jgi:hypothetical protein
MKKKPSPLTPLSIAVDRLIEQAQKELSMTGNLNLMIQAAREVLDKPDTKQEKEHEHEN